MGILKSYIVGEASPIEKLNQLKFDRREGPLVKKRVPTTIDDNGPSSNEVTRRVDDVVRLTKMFTRTNGVKYLANEVYLNTLDTPPSSFTRTKKDGTVVQDHLKNKLTQVAKGILTTGKVVASTLAQAAVSGTGLHFIRAFDKRDKRFFSDPLFAGPNDGPAGIDDGNLKQQVKDYSSRVLPISDIIVSIEQQGLGSVSPMANTAPPAEYTYVNTFVREGGDFRKESRILLGNIDKRNAQQRLNYSSPDPDGTVSDLINRMEPYKSDGVAGIDKTRDIIKFRFAVVTPDDTTYLHFRAFLKDFDDNFSANWNSYKYVGRGESFYTYDGFDRSMSFSFTAAAQTREELAPIYRKLVYLASSTAPTYSDGGYMRGTFTRLTIGDYVREMPGFIESVNYSWRDGYPWEIALNNPENGGDVNMQELPTVLDCSVNFKPIHKFVPETGLKHYITTDVVPESNDRKALFFDQSGNPLFNGEKRNFFTNESEALHYQDVKITDPPRRDVGLPGDIQTRGSLESGF